MHFGIEILMNDTPITLENFRDEIDERNLERGWFYFQKGWVRKPKEILPGYFESVVQEVSAYAVSWSMDDEGTFSDDFCTCNENQSTICRHKAAVLFLLEADLRNNELHDEHII